MRPPGPRTDLQREVEQFLYHEAWLLDERHLYEWLDLFTEDARYSMPVRQPVERPEEAVRTAGELGPPLFDDDKEFLTLRVKRLETRLAHSERPPSLTRHVIANVQVAADEDGEVDVRSNFIVFQSRGELSEQTFFGKREDRLRRVDGQWRIARRMVVLDHTPLPRTISIFF